MTRKRRYYIAGLVIVLSILLFSSIYYRDRLKVRFASDTLNKLPSFTFQDVRGRFLDSHNYKGRVLLVLFIRPLDENNLRLLNDILIDWIDRDIRILVVSKEAGNLAHEEINQERDSIEVVADYDTVAPIFKTEGYGEHFLFGPEGTLIFSAKNYVPYAEGVKPFLLSLVYQDNFSFSQLIPIGSILPDFRLEETVFRSAYEERKELLIICLVHSLCDSCQSGSFLRWLGNQYDKYRDNVGFLCVLPTYFKPQELFSITSQSRCIFPIVRGVGPVVERWLVLGRHYGNPEITNVVFIANSEGRILDGGPIGDIECLKRITEILARAGQK